MGTDFGQFGFFKYIATSKSSKVFPYITVSGGAIITTIILSGTTQCNLFVFSFGSPCIT